MSDEMETPCYVISSNGFRLSVSCEDGWCYGKSRHLGTVTEDDEAREMIKADIRVHTDYNRVPLYYVSDHGNVSKARRVSVRKL